MLAFTKLACEQPIHTMARSTIIFVHLKNEKNIFLFRWVYIWLFPLALMSAAGVKISQGISERLLMPDGADSVSLSIHHY